MRKLPSALENPVDNVLIDLAEAVSPWLRRAGQTPNMLTTYSVMSGGVALWALWNDNIAAFATCWAMRVFWDTADGSFARSYGMETRLGDAYDHANDVLSNLALLATIYAKYEVPPVFVAVYVAMMCVTFVHMGCQQKYVGDSGTHPETLDALKGMCPDTEWLRWTRWVSHGSLHLAILAGVWYMDKHCRRPAPLRDLGSLTTALPTQPRPRG